MTLMSVLLDILSGDRESVDMSKFIDLYILHVLHYCINLESDLYREENLSSKCKTRIDRVKSLS